MDVCFSCVCPVIDHEFRHKIDKVAVDPRGDSRVDPQTTLTMLWRNSLPITGQTHEKQTSICFLQQQKGREDKIKSKGETKMPEKLQSVFSLTRPNS